ncbi:MAG: hypothetical protein R3E53_19635 [Myxococcota bacterium]
MPGTARVGGRRLLRRDGGLAFDAMRVWLMSLDGPDHRPQPSSV